MVAVIVFGAVDGAAREAWMLGMEGCFSDDDDDDEDDAGGLVVVVVVVVLLWFWFW